MMAPQVLSAKFISGDAEPGKENYEISWRIPDWREVRKSESLVNRQEAVVETGSSPSAWFKTNWLIGLRVNNGPYGTEKLAQVYWKLLAITGPQSPTVEVNLRTQLWNFRRDMPYFTDEVKRDVQLSETVQTSKSLSLQFNLSLDRDLISSIGSIRYVLKLTLKTPTMSGQQYHCYKMEQFSKKSVERLQRNQAALLNAHSETGDLKFITSDGMEILAHKNILKAQCPVFEAMLNSDLSENATGIIQMNDISGKTMKIILHYFYVGELLPSWRDPDTIVEFTYAAGKYQMTEVLELLDDMLGRNIEGDATNLDVQLINLVGKLKLVNAEAKLLERIVAKLKKVGTGEEIFRLFGFEAEEISELADSLANEKVGESRILKIMEYLNGSMEDEDFFEKGISLLALLQKEGMKRLEVNLLNHFVDRAELMETADELFDLFGCGKQMWK